MPDYKNSKIYALKSAQTDKIYIGGTTKMLCQRLAYHKINFKNNINYLVDIMKYTDVRIELIENIECKDKDELNKKINEYRSKYKDNLINDDENENTNINIHCKEYKSVECPECKGKYSQQFEKDILLKNAYNDRTKMLHDNTKKHIKIRNDNHNEQYKNVSENIF
jgi:hypothetical protein